MVAATTLTIQTKPRGVRLAKLIVRIAALVRSPRLARFGVSRARVELWSSGKRWTTIRLRDHIKVVP